MAAGAPVIAFEEGGVTETVTQDTGLFFTPQTKEALIAAIHRFEGKIDSFREDHCKSRAAQFSKDHFKKNLISQIQSAWNHSHPDQTWDSLMENRNS